MTIQELLTIIKSSSFLLEKYQLVFKDKSTQSHRSRQVMAVSYNLSQNMKEEIHLSCHLGTYSDHENIQLISKLIKQH